MILEKREIVALFVWPFQSLVSGRLAARENSIVMEIISEAALMVF